MEQNKTSQERSKKSGGTSSFVDGGESSKAPRQDELGTDVTGPSEIDRHYNNDNTKQGISNRPAEEENAFPDSKPTDEPDAPDSIETTPKQQGGNRGGV